MHRQSILPTLVITVVAALIFVACGGSSGFQQRGAREADESVAPEVNSSEVERAFALRPQLPSPYRVAIHFRGGAARGADGWRWEGEHRRALVTLRDELRAGGQVSDFFVLTGSTVSGDDLHAIRVAAARHGADAVLVVTGDEELEREENGWAVSYVALLPMLFVPGSEVEAVFHASAELWDVRNEYLYLAAEAESEAQQTRALALIDSEEAVEHAQTSSLELLKQELLARFSALNGG